MAKDLYRQVEAFRTRPLDAGPYTFLAADALVLKVREGGRTVNVHALVATAVNAEGEPARITRARTIPHQAGRN
jgi:putative transposase